MSKSKGEISKSMGVNTKPAHRLLINNHWVLIDSNAPICLVYKIKSIEKQTLAKNFGCILK
jgi:hypothetical protein